MNENFDTQIIRKIAPAEPMNVSEVLASVYGALLEKGYNPIIQLVGYLISGDPTYITSHKNARSLIMKVERDEILEELTAAYIDSRLSR